MKVIAMDKINWPVSQGEAKEAAIRFFPQWVRESRSSLYATLLRIVRSESDAEDLLQETYLRALSKIDSYRGEGEPEAWLRRIAVRLALNHLRSRKLQRWIPFHQGAGEEGGIEPELLVDHSVPGPDSEAVTTQRRRRLEQILKTLPIKARTAFALRNLEDRPYSEIADLLGCSEATARSLVSRAVARLEEEIRKRGWQDE